MDLRFVKRILVAAAFFFTGLVKNVTSVGVDVELGTKQAIEGGDVTFTCDLRDTDVEYIWFRNPNYFVTMGVSPVASLPPDIRSRIGVSCSEILGACYLAIFSVKRSDMGEYTCGYQEGDTRIVASTGYLNVLIPPTDTSPQCILYDRAGYPISSEMVNVGDQVGLSCIITGGNPRPTVYLARDSVSFATEETGSFTKLYIFSQNDEGSTFTCVMTHPVLSKSRTCTLLTLRRRPIPTVKAQTTTVQLSQQMTSQMRSSQYLSTTKGQDITVPSSGQTSMDMLTITIIIVVIVIVIVIIITTVVFGIWLIKRRRSDRDDIKIYPPRASQDVTMNLVTPHAVISTDYDFFNNKDSNENLQESTINSNNLLQDTTANTSNPDDAFPVYAKPEKPDISKTLDKKVSSTKPGEYENMPPVSNGNTAQASQGEDGIMYAELELSADANTNSTIISGDANNATVYADIRKT